MSVVSFRAALRKSPGELEVIQDSQWAAALDEDEVFPSLAGQVIEVVTCAVRIDNGIPTLRSGLAHLRLPIDTDGRVIFYESHSIIDSIFATYTQEHKNDEHYWVPLPDEDDAYLALVGLKDLSRHVDNMLWQYAREINA